MVVGGHPRPELDRLVTVDTEELLQVLPDAPTGAP
jgi:hypothetical protein